MSGFERITIREVESSDLETFYQQQLDPEAIRMAAFACEDPKDKVAFDAHWDKILNSPQNTNRTIVAEGQVAGHIACYPDGEHMEVTYWLGREFWGRGLATQALTRMLHLTAACALRSPCRVNFDYCLCAPPTSPAGVGEPQHSV